MIHFNEKVVLKISRIYKHIFKIPAALLAVTSATQTMCQSIRKRSDAVRPANDATPPLKIKSAKTDGPRNFLKS